LSLKVAFAESVLHDAMPTAACQPDRSPS
jgi:hypothetical protein